jgi:hypothetical protein
MSDAESAPVVISENTPSGARLLQFRGGDSIQSSASAIAFLWSNWDILFKLSKSPFHAEKQADGIWHGGGYGGSGEWYFSAPPSIGVNEGHFEFFSLLRFLGTPVRGKSVFEYKRVSPERFYYRGRSWGEIPQRLNLLRWLIEPLGNIAAAKYNSIGGGAAELISRQPSLVERYSDPATYKSFLEMIEEENAILSGREPIVRYFIPSSRVQPAASLDPLAEPRRNITNLEDKLRANSRNTDLKEYRVCIDLFLIDPDSAVFKGRRILEPIVLTVFQVEFPRHSGRLPNGKRMTLNDRIKELTYESKNVPNGITALMQTVNGLGNVGAHFAEGKIPNVIDLAQFKTSFSASHGVADWFYNSRYSTNTR